MWRISSKSYIPALLSLLSLVQYGFAQEAPPLSPNNQGIIFQIGVEDRSRYEFKFGEWTGIAAYECTAGVDCEAASFPTRLVASYAANLYDSSTVERAMITFSLAEAQCNLAIAVARFGIERSVVRLDERAPITITQEMMDRPSAEDVWGRFELSFGPVSAGVHKVELSVLNQELGTGRHSLDEITLLSAEP